MSWKMNLNDPTKATEDAKLYPNQTSAEKKKIIIYTKPNLQTL